MQSDESIECQLSEALQFYTQTHYIKTVGVTDLHSFFIDKSIKLQSLLQQDLRQSKGVFVLAHLLELVDNVQSSQPDFD